MEFLHRSSPKAGKRRRTESRNSAESHISHLLSGRIVANVVQGKAMSQQRDGLARTQAVPRSAHIATSTPPAGDVSATTNTTAMRIP